MLSDSNNKLYLSITVVVTAVVANSSNSDCYSTVTVTLTVTVITVQLKCETSVEGGDAIIALIIITRILPAEINVQRTNRVA